ncbi:putative disease resistance protein [Senna tora]|uniref:Putative disease resistance protein n=1 Tax=Senna tora TaxID=362788 RepID=A0A835CC01_9FABA|nr:putative disease resistance protein [Senna tora]
MAAELVGGAFLQAAFQVAFERLASSDIRGYFRGRKAIDALLKKLHITLISVNQVLDDAEERQYSNSNVKKWVDELKHVVFLADDLLDEIAYEATRRKLQVESQTATSKVRGFFTSSVNQFDKEIEAKSVSGDYCVRIDGAELPANFHQLINLRHLDLVGTHIREMPQHIRRLKHLQYLPMFFVGKQSGSNIKELGEVSNLEGTLSISQLENVNNVMDAGEANLRGKKCLHKLELKWDENHDGSQNERRVLEALQPHINLKELTIINYGGTRFVGIKEIGTEFYGNESLGVGFKSLEFLEFVDMGEWEEWMHPDDECFPCLQHLSLESCPRLTNSLPPCLASLKSLHISECQQLEPPLPKVVAMTNSYIPRSGVEECWLELIMVTFPDLQKLCLNNCPKFVSFSTCQLSAPKLGYLSISNISYQSPHSASANMQTQLLPTFHSLWFKNCPLLRSLVLHNCPHLESFHMNRALPSCLVNLSIRRCPKLVHSRNDWGLHQLHSLQQFEISDDFENVESFPEEALLPPSLRTLILADCPHLKTVNYKGLLHLTSLRSLDIKHCPSLQCLPEQGKVGKVDQAEALIELVLDIT